MKGRGANVDIAALDDELATHDVARVAGPMAPAVLAAVAVAAWTGPDRLFDLALRGGPYGDRFELAPLI